MSDSYSQSNISLEKVLTTAISIPGVKVNRHQFLEMIFSKDDVDISRIIAVGPIAYGCSREMLQKKASSLVLTRTSQSSITSFLAGIPGGLALAASIPADVLQFFGMTLRLAQELNYLYGGTDLWENGQIDINAVQNELILYCGAMFGVSSATAGVRLLSSQIAKTTLKKLPQKALTKTVWYPIVKQVGKSIGVKVTKNSVAKGISGAIPIVGGAISGGLNFASMLPMGNRLAKTLDTANFCYSEEEVLSDYNVISSISEESTPTIETSTPKPSEQIQQTVNTVISGVDNSFHQLKNNISNLLGKEKKKQSVAQPSIIDPFDAIEKLAKLREIGAITEEEFTAKKAELLAKL